MSEVQGGTLQYVAGEPGAQVAPGTWGWPLSLGQSSVLLWKLSFSQADSVGMDLNWRSAAGVWRLVSSGYGEPLPLLTVKVGLRISPFNRRYSLILQPSLW